MGATGSQTLILLHAKTFTTRVTRCTVHSQWLLPWDFITFTLQQLDPYSAINSA